MSLLELEHVGKCHAHNAAERDVLRDVSLRLDVGELVSVWGRRHSGRSTLLRVVAGLEAPDSGVVRFAGRDLADRGSDVLAWDIGYCRKSFRAAEGQLVLDQLIVGQLARGVTPSLVRSRARAALERAGAERCATLRPGDLDHAELVRVAIARALVRRPRLLVIDEPTLGVELIARDGILLLLRSLADEGIAILTSTGETTGLSGADRALALSNGQLRGTTAPELAPVIPLRRPA